MSHEPFISDMGESPVLEAEDGSKIKLGRYGVWKWDASKRKHQVVDTGDDLAELQRKHKITTPPIKLGKATNPSRRRNDTYYHGTRTESLPSIQKKGLSYPFLASSPDQAWCWARNYSNEQGKDARILEVEVDDTDRVVPDYNLMEPEERQKALGEPCEECAGLGFELCEDCVAADVDPKADGPCDRCGTCQACDGEGYPRDEHFDVRSVFLGGEEELIEGARKLGVKSVPDRECGGDASIYLGDVPPANIREVDRSGKPIEKNPNRNVPCRICSECLGRDRRGLANAIHRCPNCGGSSCEHHDEGGECVICALKRRAGPNSPLFPNPRRRNTSTLTLYHGTSTAALDAIRREGLEVPCLTSDLDVAWYFAGEAAEEDGSDMVVLKVTVDTSRLRADYPAFEEPLTYWRNKHAASDEQWFKLLGQGTAIAWPRNELDWQTSLKVTTCVKYDGVVPASAIALHEEK